VTRKALCLCFLGRLGRTCGPACSTGRRAFASGSQVDIDFFVALGIAYHSKGLLGRWHGHCKKKIRCLGTAVASFQVSARMLALQRVSHVNQLVEHAVRVVADRQRLGGVLHLMRLDASIHVIDVLKTSGVPEHRLPACRTFTQLNGQSSCALLPNVQG
jgi:hypothetical protein